MRSARRLALQALAGWGRCDQGATTTSWLAACGSGSEASTSGAAATHYATASFALPKRRQQRTNAPSEASQPRSSPRLPIPGAEQHRSKAPFTVSATMQRLESTLKNLHHSEGDKAVVAAFDEVMATAVAEAASASTSGSGSSGSGSQRPRGTPQQVPANLSVEFWPTESVIRRYLQSLNNSEGPASWRFGAAGGPGASASGSGTGTQQSRWSRPPAAEMESYADRVDFALQLLRHTGQPESPRWAQMLIEARTLAAQGDLALSSYRAFKERGVQLSTPTVLDTFWGVMDSMVAPLSERAKVAVGLLDDALSSDRGAAQNLRMPVACNQLLRSCIRSFLWDVVLQVQGLMKRYSIAEDADILTFTMVHAAMADNLSLLEMSLNLVQRNLKNTNKADGRTPSPLMEGQLLEVIHCALRHDNINLADDAYVLLLDCRRRLAASLPKTGGQGGSQEQQAAAELPAPISAATYHAMALAYLRAGRWREVVELLHELDEHHGTKHNGRQVSAYHGLRHMAMELQDPSRLASLFHELTQRHSSGQPVRPAALNVLLRGLALAGDLEGAGSLFEEFKHMGVTPTLDSYNAILEGCIATKRMDRAEPLIKYMRERGVEPSARTYDLVLRGYLAARDLDGLLGGLAATYKEGLAPLRGTLREALQLANDERHVLAQSRLAAELALFGESSPAAGQQQQQGGGQAGTEAAVASAGAA